MFTCFQEGASS